MKKTLLFLSVLILFASCKSNKEAYVAAYQKLKEKEEIQVESKAKTAMTVKLDTLSNDTIQLFRTETFTVLLGERNLSEYSLVARTFVNRTNAKGYFSRLEEEGLPVVLVQSEDLLYRIIVASFPNLDKALLRKEELGDTYPGLFVLKQK